MSGPASAFTSTVVPTISIVVPTLKECCIESFLTRVSHQLSARGLSRESVVVDDGSTCGAAFADILRIR